jgi:glycosyltransferase involved in cell wall biosynthesis
LLIPLLGTHRHFDPEKYRHKTVCLAWEPNERGADIGYNIGAMTPYVEQSFPKMIPLRMGIDTNIFYDQELPKSDNLVIGFVGKPHNPRRLFKEVILPLKDIPGIELKIFVQEQLHQQDIDFCGGEEFRKRICGVQRQWVGLPNIYNQLDVMIRVDADMGYSFPCVEAIACGVPIITSDSGIDKQLTDAGCGILIESDKDDFRSWAYNNKEKVAEKYKQAVIRMRNDYVFRNECKQNCLKEIKNWTWDR